MAVFGFLFLYVVLLQHRAPPRAGIDQSFFVPVMRSQRAGNDDRFELFRAQHGAAAVGGKMIVVVGQHRSAVEIFSCGPNTQYPGIAVTDELAQPIFSIARAETPNWGCVAQLGAAVFDVKVYRRWRGAVQNDAVVTSRFEVSSPIAAGGAATKGITGERAQINGGHLGAAGSETVAGERSGHHNDAVLRPERRRIERQLAQQNIDGQRLTADELLQDRFFRKVLVLQASAGQIDAQNLAHIATGEGSGA